MFLLVLFHKQAIRKCVLLFVFNRTTFAVYVFLSFEKYALKMSPSLYSLRFSSTLKMQLEFFCLQDYDFRMRQFSASLPTRRLSGELLLVLLNIGGFDCSRRLVCVYSFLKIKDRQIISFDGYECCLKSYYLKRARLGVFIL